MRYLLIIFSLLSFSFSNEIIWSQFFGDTDKADRGHSVKETLDGGYIITGDMNMSEMSNSNAPNLTLIKTDIDGNQEWIQNYGTDFNGENSFMGTAYDVQLTQDGGYIVSGWGLSSIYNYEEGYFEYSNDGNASMLVLKTDYLGNKEWLFSEYTGFGDTVAKAIHQTEDGGYVILGYGYDPNCDNQNQNSVGILLIKINSLGQQEWNKWINDCDIFSRPNNFIQTEDGGYAIVSDALRDNIMFEALLIKSDYLGNEEWNKFFDFENNNGTYDIKLTDDNGYMLTGYNGGDLLLIKTDSNGNEEWIETFSNFDIGLSIEKDINGGYVVVGETHYDNSGNIQENSNPYILKINDDGQEEWSMIIDDSPLGGAFSSVIQNHNNEYIVTGEANHDPHNYHYSGDIILAKIGSFGCNDEYAINYDENATTDNGTCEYPETGDLNNDTLFNISDIIIMISYVLNSEYVFYADLNEDDFLNVLDILILVNWILE